MAPSRGNGRPLVVGQARRPFRPAGGRVDEALAVAMQPDDFAPECDCLVEQSFVGSERNAQAGAHEVGLEPRGEGWMRHDGRDIGHDIFRRDGSAERLRQRLQNFRAHVRLRRLGIRPERINAPPERAFVVMEVGDRSTKRKRWPRCWRMRVEPGHENLLIRPRLPDTAASPRPAPKTFSVAQRQK